MSIRLGSRTTHIVAVGHSLTHFDDILHFFAPQRYPLANMKTAFALLAAATAVSAHSTWQQLWVGSTDMGTTCARTVKDNSPITSLSSSDMFCGRGPASSSGVCEVAGKSRDMTENDTDSANAMQLEARSLSK